MLQLQTLGTLDLRTADGTPVDSLLAHPRTAALLVVLVLARPRGYQRRDRLCAMFWPDSDDAHARGALSQALSRLRRAIGAAAIEIRGADEVRVADGTVACDAVAFEEAVERNDHLAAVSLYRGTLLHGFHLRAADGFEEWIEDERSRLRHLAAGAGRSLMRQLLASGRFTEAGSAALHGLELEPASELLMRDLIEALVSRGDAIGAIRIYEGWSARLQRELEVAPSPELRGRIRELRQTLQGPTAPPRPARDIAPPAAAGPSAADSAAATPPRMRIWRRSAARLTLAGVGGAVVLGTVLLLSMRDSAPEPLPNRIVVLPFENRTGDPDLDPLGHMAADWVSRGLMQIPSLEVVPAETGWRGLEPGAGAGQGQAEAARDLGRATRAGTVVSGAYYQQGDHLWFQARITETRTGHLLPAPDPVGARRDLPLQAVEALLHSVAGALVHQRVPSFAGFAELLDQRPPSYAAYSAFLGGMDFFVEDAFHPAMQRFLDAYRADTTYLTPLIAAAMTASNLDQRAIADSLLAIAAPSRERLAPNDAFLFDLIGAGLRGDRRERLRLSRAQLARYPGSGYEFLTALAELGMNHPAAAAALLDPLRHQQNMARIRPYWQALARALHEAGDHRAELRAAREAAVQFPHEAWPLQLQAWALAALGRTRTLDRHFDAIERIDSTGDPTAAWYFVDTARELEIHGHADAADRLRERGLRWIRSKPPEERALPSFRMVEAWTLFDLGRHQEVLDSVTPLLREQPGHMGCVMLVGLAAAAVGDKPAVEEARASIRRHGETLRYSLGRTERLLAFVAAWEGDADEAVRLLREALRLGDLPDAATHRLHASELRPIRNDPRVRVLLQPRG
jgi:DNA-binding SARP family transcriptional activator/TolB-like protein/tetratricopeptide (TPR) repeat protein